MCCVVSPRARCHCVDHKVPSCEDLSAAVCECVCVCARARSYIVTVNVAAAAVRNEVTALCAIHVVWTCWQCAGPAEI